MSIQGWVKLTVPWKEQLKDLNDDYSSMKPEELESE